MPAPRRIRRLPLTTALAALLGALLLLAAPGGAVAQTLKGGRAATGVAAAAAKAAAKEVDGTAAYKWEPGNVAIKPGDSVTFKAVSGPPHPVVSGDGSNPAGDGKFDAKACGLETMSKVGGTCTVKFDKAGTYPYFCSVHLALGMKGVVTVGGDATAAPPGGVTASPSPSATPDTPSAVTTAPGKPGIYYAGWGLLALGGLLALACVAGYVRFAPDFQRERR